MARPRIIIADLDVSYIIPLQLRFVEEFYEKVDLEIITDEAYFADQFSSPQKVDILIVSERLYDLQLQRHNIGNIFVMMEQYREEETDELIVHRIYKYSSIREIFNEITAKSANVLSIEDGTKSEPKIISVFSASGGVGKTTVALGIAACLAQNYKRVLYINASYLHTFQRMLDNPTPISAPDVYSKLARPSNSIYNDIKHAIRKETFSYLPPFKAGLISLGIDYSIFEKIALSAKKSNEYDYVIVDIDSGFHLLNASLLEKVDRCVIVTQQTISSVYAANTLAGNINGISNDKYIFICNDFKPDEDNALVSPAIVQRFAISEYVEHENLSGNKMLTDFRNNKGLKKVSVLVM